MVWEFSKFLQIVSRQSHIRYGPYRMGRKASLILTFYVPPLARGQGLVISIVYGREKIRKISKHWEVPARRN